MIGTVILAAGKGYRFGEMKQFKETDGISPLNVVVNKFSIVCGRIITVVPDKEHFDLVTHGAAVVGGEYRLESIKNGIERWIDDESVDRIIIAEAARPFIEQEVIKEMVEVPGDVVIVYSPCSYVVMEDVSEYQGFYYDQEVYIHKPRGRIRIIEPPSIWRKDTLVKLLRSLKPRMASSQVPSVYAPLVTQSIGWVSARCRNPKITFRHEYAMFENYIRETKTNGGV